MEYVGWVFGMFAFLWCCSLSGKVSRLERAMKAQEGEGPLFGGYPNREGIREMLQQHIGKTMRLSFDDEVGFNMGKDCVLLDMDESWVLIREDPGKKYEMEKMFPLSAIESVTLK